LAVNPIGPRACYDEGKRCAEALATSYARQYGVEVRIARIFSTYGPRMHENDGRVVSNFVVQALAGQPLTVFGDGKQTRSFCYVSDLVEGFLRLMERDQNDVAELVDHGSGRLHRVVDVVFWIVPDLGESGLRRRSRCTNEPPVGVALEEEIHEVFHLRRIFRGKPADLVEKLISGCGHDGLAVQV
jgi:nucleoside-diphosphate-sugar epimerase